MMTLDKTLIIFIIGAVIGVVIALLPPPEELFGSKVGVKETTNSISFSIYGTYKKSLNQL